MTTGWLLMNFYSQAIDGMSDDVDYKHWIRNNVIDEMINEETMYIHDWQLKDMIVPPQTTEHNTL